MKHSIYDQIINNLDEEQMNTLKNKVIHLGIFNDTYLPLILNGQKTIESRFSKHKIEPYNNINEKDIVFIKESGGHIIGYFSIKKVMFFDMSKINIEDIKNKYGKYLCVKDSFWQSKKDSHYATLIFIKKIYNVKPFTINKKGMQSWIKLN